MSYGHIAYSSLTAFALWQMARSLCSLYRRSLFGISYLRSAICLAPELDDPLFLQLHQSFSRHSQLAAVNLFVVFAHARRPGPANLPRSAGQLGNDILHLDWTKVRV